MRTKRKNGNTSECFIVDCDENLFIEQIIIFNLQYRHKDRTTKERTGWKVEYAIQLLLQKIADQKTKS